jgi:two-component system, sensor histidine kinase and response regulator
MDESHMGEPAAAQLVVVIDDEYAMRLSCAKILATMGLRAETFEDGARGLEGVAKLKPDMVVVDLKMPGISGMEVISRVHQIDPQIVIVVITGYATIDTAVQAMKCGAYDFLPKPFSPDELRLIVRRGLERRHLALEAQRHEVERAMLTRRFVTFVSHQLRTPLVAVHQYLNVMTQVEQSPATRQEWIGRCLARIEELQNLIADWLTLARVESGTLSQERIKVDLSQLVSGILRNYEETAAAERVSLECRMPEGGLPVWGDRNCLTVLFDNLITNAIKYNKPDGKVTVTGSVSDGEVLVRVADNGIGIPEKDLPNLFGEFFRVRDESAKKATGTGLGLHISQKIAAEMGGTIDVESQVGSGSVFSVRLPAAIEAEAPFGGQSHVEAETNPDRR